MPAGLQVWNPDGVLILDTTDTLFKIWDIYEIDVNAINKNTGATFTKTYYPIEGVSLKVFANLGNMSMYTYAPTVTFVNNVMTCVFPRMVDQRSPSNYPVTSIIVYSE